MQRFSQSDRVEKIIQLLRKATVGMAEPAISQIIASYGRNPFLILISCLLSLRAKDSFSLPVSKKLFQLAKAPRELLALSDATLEQLLRPIGFYLSKTRQIKSVAKELIDRFGGQVPKTEQELLSIKGVGPKTANLVLGQAFKIPAICVDIHVHRISNRLGLVKTKTPEETEVALKKLLPQKYWIEWNHLLVMWGQNVCSPVSPHCSTCVLAQLCPKVGVTRSR